MTTPSRVIDVEGITVRFRARREGLEMGRRASPRGLVALDNVSARLFDRETLGVVGESGSGKSTLARAIVGLVRPDTGRILFRGEEINSGWHPRGSRPRIQMVFQDPYSSLNPRRRIADAIAEPAIVHHLIARDEAPQLVGSLMARVGLAESLARRRPGALSGGQRQRVAIARALAAQPDVLIADEAVSALDVSVQAQILNLFMDLQQELGLATIFISHQLGVVTHVADRVAVMYLGRVVETGRTREVFANPAHPYTRGLLDARPGRHRERGSADPALRGEIPSPLAIPTGCRFRTRCPMAERICSEVDPPAVSLSSSHETSCHFAADASNSPQGVHRVAVPGHDPPQTDLKSLGSGDRDTPVERRS